MSGCVYKLCVICGDNNYILKNNTVAGYISRSAIWSLHEEPV